MWRVLKLGYRHEPRMLLTSFGLSQLAALPDALLAVWLKLVGDAVSECLLDARPACGVLALDATRDCLIVR